MIPMLSMTLLVSSGIFALPSSETNVSDYDLNKRTRTSMREPTHVFEFEAYNVCNETYEQCFDIWGKGAFNFSQVAAQGNYVKYKENQVMESSWWRDVDFIDASENKVIFKAESAIKAAGLAGFIVIEIFEGKTSDTGQVCVYGNLFDKQNPSSKAEADCTDKAYVKIEPAN
jgi:hypothetical protein